MCKLLHDIRSMLSDILRLWNRPDTHSIPDWTLLISKISTRPVLRFVSGSILPVKWKIIGVDCLFPSPRRSLGLGRSVRGVNDIVGGIVLLYIS